MWLDERESAAVFNAMPPLAPRSPWRAMYAVGALAGLRPGEVIALEWSDVNTSASEIHVRRTVQRDGVLDRYADRETPAAGEKTKDNESRFAPMPPALVEVLKDWRRIAPIGVQQMFGATGGGTKRRSDGSRFIRQHTLGKVLRRALGPAKVQRDLSWGQATRHSFASRAIARGASIDRVAEWLGHSTAEVTRRYAHLTRKANDRELAAIDVNLAPSQAVAE
jgi:integrase